MRLFRVGPVSLVGLVLFTVGCAPSPNEVNREQDAAAVEERNRVQQEVRRILKLLPADADVSAMDEQRDAVPRGLYLTQSGEYKSLPRDIDRKAWGGSSRPAIHKEALDMPENGPLLINLPR